MDRRKVLALLSYLAVTATHHSRDEPAELLFNRKDMEHARSYLRQTLSLLRYAIGKEKTGPAVRRVLGVGPQSRQQL